MQNQIPDSASGGGSFFRSGAHNWVCLPPTIWKSIVKYNGIDFSWFGFGKIVKPWHISPPPPPPPQSHLPLWRTQKWSHYMHTTTSLPMINLPILIENKWTVCVHLLSILYTASPWVPLWKVKRSAFRGMMSHLSAIYSTVYVVTDHLLFQKRVPMSVVSFQRWARACTPFLNRKNS